MDGEKVKSRRKVGNMIEMEIRRWIGYGEGKRRVQREGSGSDDPVEKD